MVGRRVVAKRSLKRKFEQEFQYEQHDHKIPKIQSDSETESVVPLQYESDVDLARDVKEQVTVLNTAYSSFEADRAAAKRAVKFISEVAKNEKLVDLVVDCGAVPALMIHLQSVSISSDLKPCELEVEKMSILTLGLLSMKPGHQQLIVDAGALPHLIDLLRKHKYRDKLPALSDVIRRSADAINNIAHENDGIKTRVRIEGGIPPLVDLLEFDDVKVQVAAAGALRTLAFRNDENKKQIVDYNALPILVLMLRSGDTAIQHEAVGVVGNLVHSSPSIKKEVLLAGALQPVIGLLSSSCVESQKEAALLLGQFAGGDSDCKVHIVQRGAVRPLINMLESPDVHLKEMSAFALGRLAQETHNQVGIACNGGIVPLLKLIKSRNAPLQHNAVFALYGLVDNEDNVADLIMSGAVQKLQDVEVTAQGTKDCVAKTLKRLEEKLHGNVLKYLLYLMRTAEKAAQRHVVLTLAHLCSPDDRKTIFLDNNGLGLLLGFLESGNLKQQHESSVALYKLATKATLVSLVDEAPLSPSPQVYLGEQYVNNPTLSDITFSVEGRQFYAHRICLLASSDAFRAMFDGGYREKNAKDVEIPNIRWDVFESMMRFIYTGSVDVEVDIAQDLLRAADQYLLVGLKRLCEYTIAQDISVDNVSLMYELSEAFNAITLREACILFIFQRSDKLRSKPWYSHLIKRIMPEIRNYLTKAFTKPVQASSKQL